MTKYFRFWFVCLFFFFFCKNRNPSEKGYILSPAVSETLSNIFNESFALGIFPDHIKLAVITPMFKGGSKLDVSNYRPVSVLPTISKVLEKLMLTRLTKYLDKSKIIYEPDFSTLTVSPCVTGFHCLSHGLMVAS